MYFDVRGACYVHMCMRLLCVVYNLNEIDSERAFVSTDVSLVERVSAGMRAR
jgi:hypothetical protein